MMSEEEAIKSLESMKPITITNHGGGYRIKHYSESQVKILLEVIYKEK